MNQQNYEGLAALYEVLQTWSLETEDGIPGTCSGGKKMDHAQSGLEQLVSLAGAAPVVWNGNEAARREPAEEISQSQQTQDGSARQWLGQENGKSSAGLSVQSLSRAVELDARRYDGQIGQGR